VFALALIIFLIFSKRLVKFHPTDSPIVDATVAAGSNFGYCTLTCAEQPKYGVVPWGGVYYVFRYWSLVLCMDGQVPDQRSIGSKEVSVESKKLEAQ
jgi:hypothetical protein